MQLKQLIKDWTLPISMVLGAFGYLVLLLYVGHLYGGQHGADHP